MIDFETVSVVGPKSSHPMTIVHAYLSRDEDGNEGICAIGEMIDGQIIMRPLVWGETGTPPPEDQIEIMRSEGAKHGVAIIRAQFARVG